VSFLAIPGILAFVAGSLMASATLGIALSLSARTSIRAQVYLVLCLIGAVVLPLFAGEGTEFVVRLLSPGADAVHYGEIVSSASIGTTWQTIVFPIERASVPPEFDRAEPRARIAGSLACITMLWLGVLVVGALAIRRFEREDRE